MKLFVATDVHGSAYFAERIVDEFKRSNCDLLILLGDVYNHGPRNPFPKDYAPMKVAEAFNEVASKLVAVKGNCDSEVDQMISEFPFVQQVIIPFGNHRMYFTHGHVYNKDNLPSLTAGDLLFYGHFHKNEITEVDGVTCVNVSSASLPKDESAYCIADGAGITLFGFDGKVILRKKFE